MEYVLLPPSTGGLLLRPDDRWLVCANGPTVSGSVKIPCSQPHTWRAVTTIKLGEPGAEYPGDRVVEVRTRDYCSDSVGAWLGYPVELRLRLHLVPRGGVGRRQPAVGLLGEDGRVTRAGIVVVAAVAVLLTACSGDDTGPAAPPSTATASPTRTPTPGPAAVPPRPAAGACYLLAYDEALAPTTDARPVRCRRPHTAVTYRVGTLDTLVDGHLLAVDAERVQEQVTTECPARFGAFLGGTPAQLRLTSLRAVWFTPTLAQSDRGQDWFRCDVIALAGPERLARLEGPMEGVLAHPGRTREIRRLRDGRARHGTVRAGHLQPAALLARDLDVRRARPGLPG